MRQLEAPPADLAPFDTLCGAATGPIGIAVSGGGDSLALLHLANDWARDRGRQLAAFTFDHRLRPESRSEAQGVADACARLGVDHAILDWATPEGRQAPARRARHAALAEAIRARGGSLLLMGHTADDQAETFLMRARRGSTWYGLAAMQAQALSPVWPEGRGVRIGRPLLSARRADLRALLRLRGVHWVDDPSNQNSAFERVRVRCLLDASPRLAARVRHCLEGVTQLRAIEDGLTGKWLRTRVRMDADGRIEADIAGLEPECVARRAGLLIQVAAGRDARPRWEKLQLIAHRLCADRAFAGATLGGSRIKRRGKTVVFTAEYESDPLAGKRLDALRNLLSGKP